MTITDIDELFRLIALALADEDNRERIIERNVSGRKWNSRINCEGVPIPLDTVNVTQEFGKDRNTLPSSTFKLFSRA